MSEFPSLAELYADYLYLRGLLSASAPAQGAPDVERFSRVEREIEQAFTLTLFASVEAAVRTHFMRSIERGKPEWLAVPAQALNTRNQGRPHFDDVLDLWKLAPDSPPDTGDAIGMLKQLYNRRNWLAHGRYWTDRSGYPTADPDAVRYAVDEVKRRVPAFPAG
jgi:hypothetical protein